MELKNCSMCGELKTLLEYYKQKRKNGSIYYHPECKCCTKARSSDWKDDNRDSVRKWDINYLKNPKRQKDHRDQSKKQRESGYYRNWQQENKDKITKYNAKRNMHKKHDITDEEWFACLDYFDNRCAYCGLKEESQYKLHEEQFHREHVVHDGSNFIDNCVPACTNCNTAKHTFEYNNWYNEENPAYSKRRSNKIIKWITKDCFKALNIR